MTVADDTAIAPLFTADEVAALLADVSELRLFTAPQVAKITGLPESWLKRGGAARRIPCTYLGKYQRWSVQDIRDLITGGRVDPKTRGRRR